MGNSLLAIRDINHKYIVVACKGFLIGNTKDDKVIAGVKAGKRKNLSDTPDLYGAARKIVSL